MDGDGFWAVVRHRDVKEVSRNPQLFASGAGVMLEDIPQDLVDSMVLIESHADGQLLGCLFIMLCVRESFGVSTILSISERGISAASVLRSC